MKQGVGNRVENGMHLTLMGGKYGDLSTPAAKSAASGRDDVV